MEAVITKASVDDVLNQVNAAELANVLDKYKSQIKILSLDCFDTLIWRHTATPTDVFFALQHQPTFKRLGLNAYLRAQVEEKARQQQFLQSGSSEVKLKDIYYAHAPNLTESEINALTQEEIGTELENCYAFPPVIELMRKAHALGLKIIIVSDTYFTEKQLAYLLEKNLPADIFSYVSNIFCSSEHGVSKSRGLFKKICTQLYETPKKFLHLGDNMHADGIIPQALGINSLHLLQHDDKTAELIRMQALAGGLLDPRIRYDRPLYAPFRGVIAENNLGTATATTNLLGYQSLGAIMYAFSIFILKEHERLIAAGKKPKILFLLRDGYLPYLACKELAGEEIGALISISRFTAYAASFRSEHDIRSYLADNATSGRYEDMCKQLLLPAAIIANIVASCKQSTHPTSTFIQLILHKHTVEVIFAASQAYRQRLYTYLKKTINLNRGDTLLFIDLGYTGTTQIKLAPVFKDEMQIDILACYLLSMRTSKGATARRGLIDPSWCDDRSIGMLVAYIALLEQLCTCNKQSVIDFTAHGEPIYSENSLPQLQQDQLNKIQAECLRFIRYAKQFFSQTKNALSENILRSSTLAELGRLLFLPTKKELADLSQFKFDLNLGTTDLINLFDQEKGLTGLRKRGLFFMERNLKSMRTNYPAELRSAGLELVLMLMAQHRLSFDVRVNDLSLRRETLNVIFLRGTQASQTNVEALPTHDGYFSLLVPIGSGDFQVGIQFGLHYHWLQIESSEVIATDSLYGSFESDNTIDISQEVLIDEMTHKNGGLYECQSETGLLVYVPKRKLSKQHYALRVTFRPIVKRAAKVK